MKRYRFTIILATVSAVLWGLVILMRFGNAAQPFRSVYEKFFCEGMFTINTPAMILAVPIVWIQEALLGLPHDSEQVNLIWPIVIASSVQWGLVGYLIDHVLRKRRSRLP